MILTDVITTAEEDSFLVFFSQRRTCAVRYIAGHSGEQIRTEQEAKVVALHEFHFEKGDTLIVY